MACGEEWQVHSGLLPGRRANSLRRRRASARTHRDIREGKTTMAIQRFEQGPYFSKLVITDTTAYTAGLVADDLSADVGGQTRQILDQIDAYLAKAGTDKAKLLTANVWLKDIGDFSAYNAVWTEWADPENLPVRATVEAKLANPRILVEIMVTAAR
jgi:enamine deaminase RidA (YjgF/YER057c/UK114 family)